MFRFGNSELLYCLVCIPVLFAGFFILRINYRERLKKFGDMALLEGLMPMRSSYTPIIKFSLMMMVLALLIVALARPQFGTKLKEVKREGIEMMIALDVSNSMLATDISPNRLERAKQAISSLMSKMQNDAVGLIIFAGDAYIQLPITSDYASAKMFLSNVNPEYISKQGTAIAEAITLASSSFSSSESSSKAIVIISDGEDHEGNAIEAAAMAKGKGIKVYTIGMGSELGSLIPKANGSGFITDKSGNPVTSRLDPHMLGEIAVAGGGEYFTASTNNVGLNKLYQELSSMDKSKLEVQRFSEYDDQYFYFVWLALMLFVIDILVYDRKNKWLSNIKLFE
jgi:Ca-activated chloride channel family protein